MKWASARVKGSSGGYVLRVGIEVTMGTLGSRGWGVEENDDIFG